MNRGHPEYELLLRKRPGLLAGNTGSRRNLRTRLWTRSSSHLDLLLTITFPGLMHKGAYSLLSEAL